MGNSQAKEGGEDVGGKKDEEKSHMEDYKNENEAPTSLHGFDPYTVLGIARHSVNLQPHRPLP